MEHQQLTHTLQRQGLAYAITEDRISAAQPVLVMLHGFAGSVHSFNHLIPQLLPCYRIIRIDLPGHGNSSIATPGNETQRYSSQNQTADLHHIFNTLGLNDITLYGYSMGARLALQYALNQGGLLKRIVAESGTYGLTTHREQALRQKQDHSLAESITRNFPQFVTDWGNNQIFSSSTPPSEELTGKNRQIRASQHPDGLAASLLAFGTGSMPCIKHLLPGLTTPTDLITGEEDLKFTAIATEMMELIPKGTARHHIIPGVGHRVYLEYPEKVKAILKAIVNGEW